MYADNEWTVTAPHESSPLPADNLIHGTTDSAVVGVPASAERSSHDLFEGDLFGDELMEEIYNSAVADGHDHHPEYIANLLDKPVQSVEKEKVKREEEQTGTNDGLGAFRPSTSFNDLGSLLPPKTESNMNSSTAASGGATPASAKNKKKRKNSSADSSPKKKSSAVRGSPRKNGTQDPSHPITHALENNLVQPVTTVTVMPEQKTQENKPSQQPKPLLSKDPSPKTAPVTAVLQKPVVVVKPKIPGATSVRPKTNYKSLAEAAVSSLISNAKGDESPGTSNGKQTSVKVNTSTAHVKALTGNNWVTAPSTTSTTSEAAVGPSIDNSDEGSKVGVDRNRPRPTMTADDRAKQNRDRNREHARNTRLRKKAYVDELKRTLIEIVNERDASETLKKQRMQHELEQREVRFRVSEEFLKLRGRNDPNFARWSAILEDEFILTLPLTRYRGMVQNDTSSGLQELAGTTAVMSDASHLADFLQTLLNAEDSPGTVSLQYRCDRGEFFMDGCVAILEWDAAPVVGEDAISSSLSFKGCLRVNFCSASNKLLSAKLSFDTASVVALSNKKSVHVHDDAAVEAANQADAILDSLEMPHMAAVSTGVTVVPSTSSASEASYHKGGESSDESIANQNTDNQGGHEIMSSRSSDSGVGTRRSQRLSA